MNNSQIIRAWKDPNYRNSLSKLELSQIPDNPAGCIEIPDDLSEKVAGGQSVLAAAPVIIGKSYFTGSCGRVCDELTPTYGCY